MSVIDLDRVLQRARLLANAANWLTEQQQQASSAAPEVAHPANWQMPDAKPTESISQLATLAASQQQHADPLDDRRPCATCDYLLPGQRCGNWRANGLNVVQVGGVVNLLHRCPGYRSW